MRIKLILIFTSLLVSFLILDPLLYRLVPKNCTTVQPDKLVHHSLIPNKVCQNKTEEFEVEYRNNSLGLRDIEIKETKTEGEVRILFLGDSFTEGSGVNLEETMVRQVEKIMHEQGFAGIRTINSGVGAYSPLVEYQYLRNRGIKLKPDLVVVNLFMNDFNEDRMYLKKTHYDENGEIIGVFVELKQHLPTFMIDYLEDNSVAYYLFKRQERRLWKLKGKLMAKLKGESVPDYAKSGVEFDVGNPDDDPYAITREIPELVFDDLFEPVADNLVKIKSYLDDKGIPLVVVVIPVGHQVDSSQWATGRLEVHLTEDSFPEKVFDELELFSQESGIAMLNFLPDLRNYLENNREAKLYYDRDGHFTPLGQRIGAEIFVDYLMQKPELLERLREN